MVFGRRVQRVETCAPGEVTPQFKWMGGKKVGQLTMSAELLIQVDMSIR